MFMTCVQFLVMSQTLSYEQLRGIVCKIVNTHKYTKYHMTRSYSRTQSIRLVPSTRTLNNKCTLITYFFILLYFLHLLTNKGVLVATMPLKNTSLSKQVAKKGNNKAQSSVLRPLNLSTVIVNYTTAYKRARLTQRYKKVPRKRRYNL